MGAWSDARGGLRGACGARGGAPGNLGVDRGKIVGGLVGRRGRGRRWSRKTRGVRRRARRFMGL